MKKPDLTQISIAFPAYGEMELSTLLARRVCEALMGRTIRREAWVRWKRMIEPALEPRKQILSADQFLQLCAIAHIRKSYRRAELNNLSYAQIIQKFAPRQAEIMRRYAFAALAQDKEFQGLVKDALMQAMQVTVSGRGVYEMLMEVNPNLDYRNVFNIFCGFNKSQARKGKPLLPDYSFGEIYLRTQVEEVCRWHQRNLEKKKGRKAS